MILVSETPISVGMSETGTHLLWDFTFPELETHCHSFSSHPFFFFFLSLSLIILSSHYSYIGLEVEGECQREEGNECRQKQIQYLHHEELYSQTSR